MKIKGYYSNLQIVVQLYVTTYSMFKSLWREEEQDGAWKRPVCLNLTKFSGLNKLCSRYKK